MKNKGLAFLKNEEPEEIKVLELSYEDMDWTRSSLNFCQENEPIDSETIECDITVANSYLVV